MSNGAVINSYFRVCSNKYYCLLKKKSHFQGCAWARLSLVKRFFQPNPNYYNELKKFNPTQPNPSQGSNLTQPTWIMLDLWVGHFFFKITIIIIIMKLSIITPPPPQIRANI